MPASPGRLEPALVVGRLDCRFQVPATLPRRLETIDRLVRAIETSAPRAAARRLRPALGGASGVVRIRTLRLEAQIDLGCMDEAAVGERLGGLILLALVRELERGAGANVRQFADRAAYLAAFVSAVQRGDAWQAWWFREFHQLRPLGDAAAAVHVLAGAPAQLPAALGHLERAGELEPLLQRLSGRDLGRLWSALGLGPADIDGAALAAVAGAARTAPGRPARARARALRLLVIARRSSGGPPIAALARAALRFAELEAVLAEAPELTALIATQAGLYPALRRRLAAAGHAPTIAWLEPLLATDGAMLARALADVDPAPQTARSAVGGVALLLPAFQVAGVWPHLVDAIGAKRARELVLLTLLKPLGRTRALLAASDPLLASLAGLRVPPLLDARAPLEPEPDPTSWPIPAVEGDSSAFDLGARFGYPWLGGRLDRALSRLVLGLIRATAARCPPLDRLAPGAFVNLVLAQPATLETGSKRDRLRVEAPLAGVGARLFSAQPLALPWLDRPLLLEHAGGRGAP